MALPMWCGGCADAPTHLRHPAGRFERDRATARRMAEGDRLVHKGRFPGSQSNHLAGRPVFGKTLGLLGGGGRIGTAVARRARGFDMRVLYWTPRRKPENLEREFAMTYAPFDE